MEQPQNICFWECSKCGHRWTNRKAQKPVLCPKCRAYKYISRIQEVKPNEST